MMSYTGNQKLFTPIDLGELHLQHRVVMAPLTRSRADLISSIPNDLMLRYYEQRASEGGLVVSEATNISLASRGWAGAPGLWTADQIYGWREITRAVRGKGALFVAQLWHTGRSANIATTGGATPVTASVNPEYWANAEHLVSTPGGWEQPSPHRALTVPEIKAIVNEYRRAAELAQEAGFDGVELHGANGYLVDQFLQDNSNHRADEYGGSIENRTRFLLEVVEALTSVWGVGRVGVRIGPSGTWNDMADSSPDALFGYVADQLNRFDLAYLHVIEPRVVGNVVLQDGQPPIGAERLRPIFRGKLIAAGGFEPATAEAIVRSGAADAVAFGRHFVSNPDLPRRIQEHRALAPYNRETFFTFAPEGYIDYPALPSSLAEVRA